MSTRGRPRSTSLPYVPIDPHIDQHPRTLALIDELEAHTEVPIALIVEFPQKLIKFCGRQKVDGNLGALSAKALSRICCWPGDPDILLRALLSTGWIEVNKRTGEYLLHDWQEYGGQIFAARKAWTKKKQEQRAEQRYKKRQLSPGQLGDISGTSRRRPEDVPEMSRRCPRDVSGRPSVKVKVKSEVEVEDEQIQNQQKENTKRKSEADLAVDRLVAHWLSHFEPGKKRITKKQLSHLRARLKAGWTEGQLERCLELIATSPWHIENGQVRLELACRSDDQVQQCLDKLDAKPVPKLTPQDEAFKISMDAFMRGEGDLDD